MPKFHHFYVMIFTQNLFSTGLTTSCNTKRDIENGTPASSLLLKAQLFQQNEAAKPSREGEGGGDGVYFATSKNVQHQSNIGFDEDTKQHCQSNTNRSKFYCLLNINLRKCRCVSFDHIFCYLIQLSFYNTCVALFTFAQAVLIGLNTSPWYLIVKNGEQTP